jgi:hypothetical protein
LDETEDLFLLAFVATVAAVLLVAALLYMNYIDGPPLPLNSDHGSALEEDAVPLTFKLTELVDHWPVLLDTAL